MFLSRRGNPPKGFRSSEVIYGKKASWLMQYTAAINQITLNVPPQRRYPDRPPLMVKDELCWYVVLCGSRGLVFTQQKPRLETQNQGAVFTFI